jgi:hypothetical protein
LAPIPSTWANQKLGLTCQTHLSNHIRASLTRIKYDNKTQRPQLTTISGIHSVSEDNFIDDDGWNFYDGPFDGDMIPNDEDHGICTQDDMLLDGLEMAPANFSSPGVT